jgi:hypothetical protein
MILDFHEILHGMKSCLLKTLKARLNGKKAAGHREPGKRQRYYYKPPPEIKSTRHSSD